MSAAPTEAEFLTTRQYVGRTYEQVPARFRELFERHQRKPVVRMTALESWIALHRS